MSPHPTTERSQAQPPRTESSGVFQVVELEAGEHLWEPADGALARAYTYNAQVPGPVIEATVGDTLLVRFTNRLLEPTTVHWHGLRLPATVDGNDPSAAVAPGDTVDYRFALPDAGTFWYHAHPFRPSRSHSGMYGALVVRDPAEPPLDDERVLVFGELPDRRSRASAPHPPRRGQRSDHQERSPMLVNGVHEPQMEIEAGLTERWRLINASPCRYVRLSLTGHLFRILATDGGLISAPEPVVDVLLPPGDRYDVAVGPFPPDTVIALEALPHAGATDAAARRRLATLHATALQRGSAADVSRFRRHIELLADPAAELTRVLHLGRRPAGRSGGLVTGSAERAREHPVRVGQLQSWELVNDTGVDQPFHLTGFFFQVLAVNGTPPPYRSWEDTINVPARSRVRIAWYPDDRPGWWTYRSNEPDHLAVGTANRFEVVL